LIQIVERIWTGTCRGGRFLPSIFLWLNAIRIAAVGEPNATMERVDGTSRPYWSWGPVTIASLSTPSFMIDVSNPLCTPSSIIYTTWFAVAADVRIAAAGASRDYG